MVLKIIPRQILAIPVQMLFGIVGNLFNPLFGLGYVFTILSLLIRNKIIHLDDFNFANNLLSPEITIPTIGLTAFLIFFGYKHKFDNDRPVVKTAGLISLPIIGTSFFFFSYVMGLLNLWISITAIQSGSSVDPYISYSFSAWSLAMSWFMRQQLEGMDGKSGDINKGTRFLLRRFPVLAKYDHKMTQDFILFVCRLTKPNKLG